MEGELHFTNRLIETLESQKTPSYFASCLDRKYGLDPYEDYIMMKMFLDGECVPEISKRLNRLERLIHLRLRLFLDFDKISRTIVPFDDEVAILKAFYERSQLFLEFCRSVAEFESENTSSNL